MDRKEAIRNISLVTGEREEYIEAAIDELNRRQKLQTYALVNYSIFSSKSETSKPLTPKQYGLQLLTRKNKRK